MLDVQFAYRVWISPSQGAGRVLSNKCGERIKVRTTTTTSYDTDLAANPVNLNEHWAAQVRTFYNNQNLHTHGRFGFVCAQTRSLGRSHRRVVCICLYYHADNVRDLARLLTIPTISRPLPSTTGASNAVALVRTWSMNSRMAGRSLHTRPGPKVIHEDNT